MAHTDYATTPPDWIDAGPLTNPVVLQNLSKTTSILFRAALALPGEAVVTGLIVSPGQSATISGDAAETLWVRSVGSSAANFHVWS
jgi:hypothetical protein